MRKSEIEIGALYSVKENITWGYGLYENFKEGECFIPLKKLQGGRNMVVLTLTKNRIILFHYGDPQLIGNHSHFWFAEKVI